MPLVKVPPLLVCADIPEPHIQVLLWQKYVTTSFMQPNPYDKKEIAFFRDVRFGKLLTTVDIPTNFLELDKREVPGAEGVSREMDLTPPRTLSPTLSTTTSKKVRFPLVSITPLVLTQLLLEYSFLTLANAWPLVATRVESLGHAQ